MNVVVEERGYWSTWNETELSAFCFTLCSFIAAASAEPHSEDGSSDVGEVTFWVSLYNGLAVLEDSCFDMVGEREARGSERDESYLEGGCVVISLGEYWIRGCELCRWGCSVTVYRCRHLRDIVGLKAIGGRG